MKINQKQLPRRSPLDVTIQQNTDGSFELRINGALILSRATSKDLLAALSKRFGYDAPKQFIGASNERPSAAGNIEVKRDYAGGGFLVTKTVGHEVKRYRFSDETRARQFASELAAGRYPSSATTSLQAANEGGECFLIEGPTVPLRRMFSPDGH